MWYFVGLICAGIGVLAVNVFDIVEFSNADSKSPALQPSVISMFLLIYVFLFCLFQSVYLAIMGFVVGFGIAVTPLSVIDSSIATIFVCFAEDPAAFQQSHPDLYQPLIAEWHALYPEIMVACGYWRT
jgi:hypothetical protein